MWEEGSDFTIRPSGKDRLTVVSKEHAVALKPWNFNSQEFLSSFRVPDSNIVQTAGGEKFRVSSWEANIINSFVVTGVSQFWGDVISIAPVDSGLGGTAEEVG